MTTETKKSKEIQRRTILNYIIIVLVMALLCAAAVFADHMIMQHTAAEQIESAYQQALTEAGAQQQVIEVAPDIKVDAATIREVIAPASKLIAYEYYYTDADVYEKKAHFFGSGVPVPFTTDRTVYTYSGTVSVGIELKDIEVAVDDAKKQINIQLPLPQILSHQLDLDSFKTYDVKNSVFTNINLEEYVGMQTELMNKQESKVRANDDIWKKLKENTEEVLRGLITATGQTDNYDIVFNWNV